MFGCLSHLCHLCESDNEDVYIFCIFTITIQLFHVLYMRMFTCYNLTMMTTIKIMTAMMIYEYVAYGMFSIQMRVDRQFLVTDTRVFVPYNG